MVTLSGAAMMKPFRVSYTGDYLNEAGEPVIADLAFDLYEGSAVQTDFLRRQSPKAGDTTYWDRLYSLEVSPEDVRERVETGGVGYVVVDAAELGKFDALDASVKRIAVGAKPGAATVPTTSTPCACRSSQRVAAMATTSAINDAGQVGQRRSTAINAPLASATTRWFAPACARPGGMRESRSASW